MRELIYEIIESCGKAARLCKETDSIWYRFMLRMDGCFHSSCSRWNRRTDEFGDLLKPGKILPAGLDAVRMQ